MYERLMIMLALCEPTLCEPTLCNVGEGGDGGAGGGIGDGGGGGTPPPKTFTQEDINRIAAREKQQGIEAGKKAAEEAAKAELAARDARIAELELAGKTQAERDAIERKQREDADKKAREARETQLTKERDDAKALAADRDARWKGDRIRTAVTTALIESKAIASATGDAAEAFARAAKIDTDDDGQITNVIYGGKSYPKVADAAAEFLKEKPHFAQASGTNGAGSRGSNGGGGNGAKPLHQMTNDELLALEEQQSQQRK